MEIAISETKDFDMGSSLKVWEESPEEEEKKRQVTSQREDSVAVGDRHASEEEVLDGNKCLRDAQ